MSSSRWVRNAWYVAAWDREVEPGKILARTIIDQPLVIYRTKDGKLVALEDRCCHRFAPLSLGRLEGDDLRCMYHGLKFAPDGRCIEIPGQRQIPQSACVRQYAVQQSGSWIWIWMGDAAEADRNEVRKFAGVEQRSADGVEPDGLPEVAQVVQDARHLAGGGCAFDHLVPPLRRLATPRPSVRGCATTRRG